MDRRDESDDFEVGDNPDESDTGFELFGEEFESTEDVGSGELEFPEYETVDELDEPFQLENDATWEADAEFSVSETDDEFDGGGYEFGLVDEDEEDDADDEEIRGFIKKIGRGIRGVVRKGAGILRKVAGPLLKTLAPLAVRIVSGVIGGPAGAKIGGTIASAILRESEMESAEGTEAAFERDGAEFEAVGGDIEVFEAMQSAADDMAEADSERRVNRAFVRMTRLAMRLFGRNRRLRPIIPLVVRAALALVKTFRANRKTRWAIRTIPLIIRRTLTRLARARRIDRKMVVVAMSRETAWVLANRRRAATAMRGGGRRRRRSRRRRANREEWAF